MRRKFGGRDCADWQRKRKIQAKPAEKAQIDEIKAAFENV